MYSDHFVSDVPVCLMKRIYGSMINVIRNGAAGTHVHVLFHKLPFCPFP